MWKVLIKFLIFLIYSVHSIEGYGKIVGGSDTVIQNYPFAAAILHSYNQATFTQQCGGSVLNIRSILTAAHCINPNILVRYRARLGSSFANSGGMVYNIAHAFIHPAFNINSMFDSDIALIHTATPIVYIPTIVAQASIAGPNYVVHDNVPVTAIGWGLTSQEGTPSEQLQNVQIFKVNHDICKQRWLGIINDNMMCAGVLDVGGRGQCVRDFGSPLLHNNVIVGVASFVDGSDCVSGFRPNVNVRVSRFTAWIQANA